MLWEGLLKLVSIMTLVLYLIITNSISCIFNNRTKPQLTYVVSISIFDYTWNRPHICFIFTLHVFQLKYKITHITFSITILCTCYASLATFSDKSVFKSINFVNFHEKVVKFQYRIGHCRTDDYNTYVQRYSWYNLYKVFVYIKSRWLTKW